LPDSVDGLNEFSVRSNKYETPKVLKPTIRYGSQDKPLLEKKVYLQKHSKETKSYSEYLTSKVRELGRDALIWKNAPKPYSMVVRYSVSPAGLITDIEIVEESGNIQMDALVISVVQSMSPLIKPKKNKKLVITELFWNTRGADDLTTDLQKSLVTYPDGRIIESVN
jgi:TonB family protein